MFEDILKSFKDKIRIYISEYNGKPVAAIWLLFYNNRIRYWYAGVKYGRSILKMQPYHILFWEAIKYGCEHEYKVFNFGGVRKSANVGGLYSFKKRWADEIIEIPAYFYLNKGKKVPSLDNKRFRFIEKMWRKTPMPFIKAISPFAIRQFV